MESGKKYRVEHKDIEGNKIKATRIFKWCETRFDTITCFVFTTKINKSVTASWDGETLKITGKRLPAQELSIPYYQIVSCVSI